MILLEKAIVLGPSVCVCLCVCVCVCVCGGGLLHEVEDLLLMKNDDGG